jgi:hypothetical protein
MTRKRETERQACKRRGARRVRVRRAFDEIFEDEEREAPLGGDDKPPAGQ